MFQYAVMVIDPVTGHVIQSTKTMWYVFDRAVEYKNSVHADLRPFIITVPDDTAQMLINAFGWRFIA